MHHQVLSKDLRKDQRNIYQLGRPKEHTTIFLIFDRNSVKLGYNKFITVYVSILCLKWVLYFMVIMM